MKKHEIELRIIVFGVLVLVNGLFGSACELNEKGNSDKSSLFALFDGSATRGRKCFVYVANSGSNTVSAYVSSNRTGKLEPIGSIGTGSVPYAITTDPAGNFVYVANHDSKNISIYSIDAESGLLTETSDSPIATPCSPGALTFNENFFTYAYIANTDASLVTPYRADWTTGGLTYLNYLNPISCTNYSWAITCDPSGNFVYVANRDSSIISFFAIDLSTGDLKSIAGSPIASDSSPTSIVINPSGTFLYAANYGSHKVTAYAIDSTGALTLIGSYSAGTNPMSVAMDPSGKFVYVANLNSNNVSVYSIDTLTGALTEISGSPFDNGPDCLCPFSISVEPSGKFAYVANNYTGNVLVYSINAKSGALTRVGSPVATGQWPFSIITVQKIKETL